MAANQIIPFATGAGAEVVDPVTYAAEGYIQQGFQAGILQPYDLNTVLRQSSFVAATLAQFIADHQANSVNDDGNVGQLKNQLLAALLSAVESEGIAFCSDTGTADALVATPSPALSAYKAGQVVAVQKNASVSANQTDVPTIALDGLAAVTITKASGMPLYPGDLPQGSTFVLVYDGTYFRHIGLTPSTADLRVQAGQAVVFASSGSNTYTGTLTPAPAALTPRMEVLGFFVTANTAAAAPTLLLNGLGSALPILKQGGGVPAAGDVSGILPLVLNSGGTVWIINGLVSSDVLALIPTVARPKATGNQTVYFSPTGSDTTGNGTQASPFASFFKTFQTLAQYDYAGLYTATAVPMAGTYTGYGWTVPYALANCPGGLSIVGNAANPSSVVINTTASSYGPAGTDANTSCIDAINGAVVNVSGIKVQSAYGHGLYAQGAGAIVSYTNMIFGACPNGSHANGVLGGNVILGTGTTSYGITGGAISHIGIGNTSNFFNNAGNVTVTLTGTPAFSSGFISMSSGTCQLGVTFSGAATGKQYAINDNAILYLGGITEASIPGNAVGTMLGGARVDGGAGYDWTTYTPALAAANGSVGGSASASWRRVDKTIHWTVSVSIGSASGCSIVSVTAPPIVPSGTAGGGGREIGSTGKGVAAAITSGATQIVLNLADVSALAAGYNLVASGSYPIAA